MQLSPGVQQEFFTNTIMKADSINKNENGVTLRTGVIDDVPGVGHQLAVSTRKRMVARPVAENKTLLLADAFKDDRHGCPSDAGRKTLAAFEVQRSRDTSMIARHMQGKTRLHMLMGLGSAWGDRCTWGRQR